MPNTERGGRKVWFFLAIAVICYVIWSLVVAGTTADDCGNQDKEWQIAPPEWECQPNANFG
jgi:hypothetical protein